MRTLLGSLSAAVAILLPCVAAHAATYSIDNFSITAGGATTPAFEDTFSDGTPPLPWVSGYSLFVTPLPANSESGGRLHIDPQLGPVFGTGRVSFAAPQLILSAGQSFVVQGRFDFAPPVAGESYFIRLDELPSSGVAPSKVLAVANQAGQTSVTLLDVDPISGAITPLTAQAIDPQGASQIVLRFASDGGSSYQADYAWDSGAFQQISDMSTASGHQGFVGAFGAFAAPVPEPETAVLMLAGLGALGLAQRRRAHPR